MNMNVPFSWLLAALAALMLAGCASSPETGVSSRYALAQDRAPAGNFDVSSLSDAQPRYEEPRQAGNKSPYTVWGKTYRVLASNDGYVARGTASWYGEKFHGHKTSNGEIFDMYQMVRGAQVAADSQLRAGNQSGERTLRDRSGERPGTVSQ